MFKLVKTLTTWWPVKVYEPDPENPGTFVSFEFQAEFEILDREQVARNEAARAAVFAKFDGATGDDRLRDLQRELDDLQTAEFLRVMRNWRGVIDDDNQPLTFSEQALIAALNRNHVREGISVAYSEAIDTGKARQGN